MYNNNNNGNMNDTFSTHDLHAAERNRKRLSYTTIIAEIITNGPFFVPEHRCFIEFYNGIFTEWDSIMEKDGLCANRVYTMRWVIFYSSYVTVSE